MADKWNEWHKDLTINDCGSFTCNYSKWVRHYFILMLL